MTDKPVAVERAHAELGASNAKRWMSCPGSVALSRGLPDEGSIHSQEGTAAHALAERCLRSGVEPVLFLGIKIGTITVTQEMVDAVEVFVTECRKRIDEGIEFEIEAPLTLEAMDPPDPMFGTADFVAFDPESGWLSVIDFKYGSGVVVEAVDNPQLRYYALGALLRAEQRGQRVKVVEVGIVQPRAHHAEGAVRTEMLTLNELADWADELMERAEAAMQPDAPLQVGEHCRFCRAAAICPAQREHAQALAQIEFTETAIVPPQPASLTDEQLADILDKLPILEAWAKGVRAHATQRLQSGVTVTGWKLVDRRPTRKWASDEAIEHWLNERGFDPEEYREHKMRSPAQIEKLLGKEGKKELPSEFIVKESSGVTLAPDSDARPALEGFVGQEFGALQAGSGIDDE